MALRFLTNVPDQVCDPNGGAARTPEQWFRTDCFARLTLPADAGQNGDAGRNTIRGPGLSRTDLSLFKTFPIAGEHRLQLRIEAFNLFDTVNWDTPSFSAGSNSNSNGMIDDTTGSARIMQFALTYNV